MSQPLINPFFDSLFALFPMLGESAGICRVVLCCDARTFPGFVIPLVARSSHFFSDTPLSTCCIISKQGTATRPHCA